MAALMVLAIGAPVPLFAQGFSRTGVPGILPVYRQARPAYDAPKLDLGSFMMSPSVEQSLSGADNIFASDRFPAGDVVSTTGEDLTMQSQWSRHSLNGHLYSSQEFYKDHSTEDANVFGAEGGGQFDVSNHASVTLAAGFVQQPQQRNSPQADVASQGRPVYNTLSGAIGYNQDWNLLRNQIQVEVTKTAYIANAQAARSATELRYHDRLSFAVTAYVWPFVQATYSTRNWLRNGSTRNFDTFTAVAGLRMEITDLVDTEFGAGILRQQYRNDKFDTLVRPTFSGELTWNVTPLTTLSASANRKVAGIESFCDPLQATCGPLASLSSQRGSLELTSFDLGAQHEFWHNLLGEARFGFEEDKFDPAGLIDRNYFLNANGRILINRNLELDISYTYNARDANQNILLYNSGPYSGNAVSLTLKAAM